MEQHQGRGDGTAMFPRPSDLGDAMVGDLARTRRDAAEGGDRRDVGRRAASRGNEQWFWASGYVHLAPAIHIL